jgi:hypothetical protein
MVEHGIVLHSDGPPWPKHDAQIFQATPSGHVMVECVWVRGWGRESVCVHQEESLRSGLLKIGGIEISRRHFLSFSFLFDV